MKRCLLFLVAVAVGTVLHAQEDSTNPSSSKAILYFQVQSVDNVVVLKWAVEDAGDFKSFEVERSDDGIHYLKVGSKLSISKNSSSEYDFVDATPKRNALLQYRLKLISKDGYASFSMAKDTRTEPAPFLVRLKQNPVKNNIDLDVDALAEKQATIAVVSHAGQQMSVQTLKLTAGRNQLTLPAQALQQGLYQLVMEVGTERKVISFIKD